MRETQSALPGRDAIQAAHATPGVNVVASQATAAVPESGLSRLSSALGVLEQPLAQATQDYVQERQAQRDLDGKAYGLEVAREASRFQDQWNGMDNGELEAQRYHEEALAKLDDPLVRRGAERVILHSMQQSYNGVLGYRKRQLEIQTDENVRKVIAMQTETGVLTTRQGMDDTLSYLNHVYENDPVKRREAGALIVQSLINKAYTDGSPEILDQALLRETRIDDVSLETLYGDVISKGRASAEQVRVERYAKAHSEERIANRAKVEAGQLSPAGVAKLRKASPDLYSQSEWESLALTAHRKLQEGAELASGDMLLQAGRLTEATPKVQQATINKHIKLWADEGKSAAEIVDLVSDSGVIPTSWETTLNHFPTTTPDNWDGKTVPERFKQAYALFSDMEHNSTARARALKDRRAAMMLEAYDYAIREQKRPEADAYAYADQVVRTYNKYGEPTPVSTKLLDSSVAALMDIPGWTDAKNPSMVRNYLERNAARHKAAGIGDEKALELTAAEFKVNHRVHNDYWVFTGGANLPADIDELFDQEVNRLVKPEVDPDDFDADDYHVQPHPSLQGIWIIADEVGMPTGKWFDINDARKRLHAGDAPAPTAAELAEEQNFNQWRTRKDLEEKIALRERIGDKSTATVLRRRLSGEPEVNPLDELNKALGPAADPTVGQPGAVKLPGAGDVLKHTGDALKRSFDDLLNFFTQEREDRKEFSKQKGAGLTPEELAAEAPRKPDSKRDAKWREKVTAVRDANGSITDALALAHTDRQRQIINEVFLKI